MFKKLMEINDEAVRLRAERDEYVLKVSLLEGHIKSLQADRDAVAKQCDAWETDFEGVQEHAERLQAELDATRKQLQELCSTKPVQKPAGGGLLRDVSHYIEMAETDTPDAPIEPKVKVKVQEGWWSQRGHGEVYVRPTSSSPDNESKRTKGYVWSDGVRLYLDNGRHRKDGQTPHDLVKFLGKHLKATNEKADDAQPEPEPEPEPQPVQEVTLSAYVVADTVSPRALRIVWATEEWIQQSKFGIVHPMADVMFLDQDRFTPEQFSLTLMLSKQ